jgi:hypothetical protein
MRDSIHIGSAAPARFLAAAGLALMIAGCASPPGKPALERGWIGGEYRPAKTPKDPRHAGIGVGALKTNTPAALAGLQAGDVILELDRQPVTKLKDFWRKVDSSKPGTSLPVKIYRDGGTFEYNMTVGRETFRNSGYFSIVMPSAVHQWNLWAPAHGFSLVFAGFELTSNYRHDVTEHTVYDTVYDRGWGVWLAFMQISKGKTVLSQECAGPEMAMRISGMAAR